VGLGGGGPCTREGGWGGCRGGGDCHGLWGVGSGACKLSVGAGLARPTPFVVGAATLERLEKGKGAEDHSGGRTHQDRLILRTGEATGRRKQGTTRGRN